MRADLQNFKYAASVSLRGLGFQVFSGAVMLVYAAIARDGAGYILSAFLGVGVLAWLTLFIVFDQHRRERIEAMEAEALASAPGAGGSVFEGQEDFRPAAKRLAALYKVFVPASSILIGLILLGVGAWQGIKAYQAEQVFRFAVSTKPGWALGLGAAMAVLGFIGARYVAGLSKVGVWANLRGGAAWTIGSTLAWGALALAHMIDYVGTDTFVKHLAITASAFMVLIGLETFVNFVLAVYRPRRAGESPRPAFDSNVLALFATPDRVIKSVGGAISYQLGFDVTKGWLWQLLSRRMPLLLGVGLVVLWLLTSIVTVEPHQRAMILRWGRPVQSDVAPGLHFKAPWPIDTVYVPEYYTKDDKGRLRLQDRTVTGLRRVELGTNPPANKDAVLWTNDHIGEEVWQYVRIGGGKESRGLTDVAVVSVEMPMQFTVTNVEVFDRLGPPEQREAYLRAVARREVTRFFQTASLDEVLGGDRAELSAAIRGRVQMALDALNPGPDGKPLGAGVQVQFLAISGSHPPKDIANSFEGPVQASQRREARVSAAETEAAVRLTQVAGNSDLARSLVAEIARHDELRNQAKLAQGTPGAAPLAAQLAEQEIRITGMLGEAGGSAGAAISTARAARWSTHMTARRDAVRYAGQLAVYEASPEVFMLSKYFETLRGVMKDARVYIVPDRVATIRTDLDLTAKDTGMDIFRDKDTN